MPQVIVQPNSVFRRHQLREEGGTVTTEGMVPPLATGTVRGVMRDSANRPLAGAVVRALGTPRPAVSGPDGSYRLDSLPPGSIAIAAHVDAYDAIGLLAASHRLDVSSGREQRVDLRAPNALGMRNEACPSPPVTRYQPRVVGRGALRLLFVDSATAVPIPAVQFLVSWPLANAIPGAEGEQLRRTVTDARGAATFCDLPPGIPLEVSLLGNGGRRIHVMMITVPRAGIVGRVITGRLNR
jgi:hypothetical protein